jgi:hypothetical protein
VEFDFSEEKNKKLFEARGVTFYQAIEVISEKGVLLDFDHPNQNKYPGQRIFVLEIDDYAYCVPYIIDGDTLYLKTLYPNRKFSYLLETGENDG